MTDATTMRLENGRIAELESFRAESLRLALRITGNPSTAEDAVQTAFLKILQAPNVPQLAPLVRAYIRRAVIRSAMDALQRRHEWDALTEPSTPSRTQERLEVRDALARLSPEHQTILALAIGEELSYKEIAAAMEIPMGTVASRLHAAKAAFRAEWEITE